MLSTSDGARPGRAARDFLLVEDAAKGLVDATRCDDGAEPVNLGTGREIGIRELALAVARATGFDGALRWDPSRPGGQPRRRLDVSRAARAFGFPARTSLEDGLGRTVACYLANREPAGFTGPPATV